MLTFIHLHLDLNFVLNKENYNSSDHLVNLDRFLNTKIKACKFNFKKLSEKYISEAKRLLPDKNYVGFSLTQGNAYRKKLVDKQIYRSC